MATFANSRRDTTPFSEIIGIKRKQEKIREVESGLIIVLCAIPATFNAILSNYY
ncbi:hypothetical protein L917_12651 [Phytophthora nicotianae]|uniref:Uncharacterized protein n=1 Tax=Phytophthora nicotianae TaxID=4792 RepID=W2KUK6_PHYNI|nr:hypothetical protein L917_12651 [Phytophthora nicotianae]